MDRDLEKIDRQDLERRADRLGIPFTSGTTELELHEMVQAREAEMGNDSFALVKGRWEIEGILPNELTFVNGKFFAAAGTSQPECFGDLWDGATGGAAECVACVFSPVCLESMAQTTLPAAQAALGQNATLPNLAETCEISEQSILALMARKAAQPEVAPKSKRKPKDAETELTEPITLVSDGPLSDESVAPEPIVEEAPAVPPPKKKRGRPAKAKVAEPEIEPAKEQAPEKQETAKPPKKKKPAKEAKPDETPDPQTALVVKRVKAGALRRERKERSARTAKAQVGAPPGSKWGENTWNKRWERERKRCPSIRKAVVGSVVTVSRTGKTYKVKVCQGYYEINGEKCATLCEAAKIATGNANWSATKFWGLDKVLIPRPKS